MATKSFYPLGQAVLVEAWLSKQQEPHARRTSSTWRRGASRRPVRCPSGELRPAKRAVTTRASSRGGASTSGAGVEPRARAAARRRALPDDARERPLATFSGRRSRSSASSLRRWRPLVTLWKRARHRGPKARGKHLAGPLMALLFVAKLTRAKPVEPHRTSLTHCIIKPFLNRTEPTQPGPSSKHAGWVADPA